MSQEPPPPQDLQEPMPHEEERLSGTLLGGFRSMSRALGGLSTAFVLVGSVSLVLGLILLAFFPDLRLYGYIVLGAAGVLLTASVVISFETFGEALTSRRGRYGTNTAIMIVAAVSIAALANFLAFENPKRFDVTATKQFSLAPRTVDLLKGLDEDVEAKVFFEPGRTQREDASIAVFRVDVEEVLREFRIRSGKFSYEFVDPIVEPLVAGEYGATRYPTIVFENVKSKKRQQVPLTNSMEAYFRTGRLLVEQEFVTGLLIVTGQEQKQVYFLTGHGERDIVDEEPNTQGYGFARAGILGENYAVSNINLSLDEGKERLKRDRCDIDEPETGQNGDRCKKQVNMLVMAGPSKDLLDGEVEILHGYLKEGGNMLVLLEPDTPETVRDLLARWGVVVNDGHIVDLQRSVGDNNEITVMARDQYFTSIPDPLGQLLAVGDLTGRLDTTYYPGVASLEPADEGVMFFPASREQNEEEEDERPPTIFGTALGLTSGESWLIEDPTRNEPRPGDRRDFFFPAVAIKAFAPLDEEPPASLAGLPQASLVVVGDSDFANNTYFHTSSNSDLFLNSVNWLVGDIALANIRPKLSGFRLLDPGTNGKNVMRYTGWLLLPFLMALAGGFVWWRRR